jgi:hypothetical protein
VPLDFGLLSLFFVARRAVNPDRQIPID